MSAISSSALPGVRLRMESGKCHGFQFVPNAPSFGFLWMESFRNASAEWLTCLCKVLGKLGVGQAHATHACILHIREVVMKLYFSFFEILCGTVPVALNLREFYPYKYK